MSVMCVGVGVKMRQSDMQMRVLVAFVWVTQATTAAGTAVAAEHAESQKKSGDVVGLLGDK